MGGTNGETHGYFHRPIVCIGDLNHDCIVDAEALALLGFDSILGFNAWRAQSTPAQVEDALDWLVNFLTSTR